jgi:hypothetical protein
LSTAAVERRLPSISVPPPKLPAKAFAGTGRRFIVSFIVQAARAAQATF